MAVGDLISSARYNAMQTAVNSVLGTGAGDFGYGQTLSSSQVVATNTINATHMQRIRTDLINAHAHQNGAIPVLPAVVVTNDITDVVYAQYEAISTGVTGSNRFNIAPSEATSTSRLVSSRSTAWGGGGTEVADTIRHIFTVTFASRDDRRYFFNSGGEVRFAAANVSSGDAKSNAWTSFLSAMSTIKFTYTTATSTAAVGTSANIGNYDLTAADQIIYTYTGGTSYSNSSYIIKARGAQADTNIITFTIEFRDGTGSGGGENPNPGPGGFIDEDVTGTISSSISDFRATGTYVSVPSPVYVTTTALTAAPVVT